MHQLLLTVAHSKVANIRVAFTSPPDAKPDAGAGVNVFVDNATGDDKLWRFYNPAEVTSWFQHNSVANEPKWREAYHRSGLGPDDFKRPVTPQPTDFVLDVPYFSQRDNRLNPNGSCNVTSYAMVLAYHKARRQNTSYVQFEDELNAYMTAHGLDRHSHDDLTQMGRAYGMNAHFGTGRTLEQIRGELRARRPVVVSTQLTSAGHIIAIVGLKGDGFVCNDPWGDASTHYRNHDGRGVVYSNALMLAKMKATDEDAKWAHFIAPK